MLIDYRKIKLELNEKMAQIRTESSEIFKKAIQDIIAEYPALQQIRWDQWTPYFNDGDVCEFRSNASSGYISFKWSNKAWRGEYSHYDNDEEENDTEETSFGSEITEEYMDEAEKKIAEFFELFEDADYLTLFGDHCSVIISRNGIDVEEYDHD